MLLIAWLLCGLAGAILIYRRGLWEFPQNPPLPSWLLVLWVCIGPCGLVAVLLLWVFDRLDADL
jgi:hypothetical protein